ncbi:hypothetical protein Q3G72_020184 [Acer saccharum]|nr:hypothetical protein Q3G72_020184 [Acer saccharum]
MATHAKALSLPSSYSRSSQIVCSLATTPCSVTTRAIFAAASFSYTAAFSSSRSPTAAGLAVLGMPTPTLEETGAAVSWPTSARRIHRARPSWLTSLLDVRIPIS